MGAAQRASYRAWLEYVVATGIELLDQLDAAEIDLEDDELEDDREEAA
ncbi:MAG TPA: hypothetical protein VIJ94_09325 [Caulobacteraceae bacterium]